MTRPSPPRRSARPATLQFGLQASDRAAFAAFLQSPAMASQAMDLHMIQGLAVGLVLGPRLISPALWMAWVWDREQGIRPPAFDDEEHVNRVYGWLMAVYNEAAERLGPAAEDDGPPYTPLFAEAEAEAGAGQPQAVAHFCAGLQRAMALGGEHDWAPLRAEWPQWIALIESPAPDAAAVLAMLPALRQYWRGRTDRLEPLKASTLFDELRAAFEFFQRPFPAAAVALAEQHREVVAPWLVHVLEDLARDPSPALDDDYVLHDFAMVLLGHWRDTRAYQPLLALARLPGDTLEQLFGDLLFETYTRALASVCDGDMAPLQAIVEDDSADVWTRAALIDAWVLCVIEGDAPAAPLEDCLLAIGEREAARVRAQTSRRGVHSILTTVVNAAADIGSQRLRDPVLGWFDERLIDPLDMSRNDYETDMRQTIEQRRAELRERGRSYLRDPEREISWWAQYHEDPEAPPAWHPAPPGQTIVREAPKIGRNDPCPCGSGRKYKKCHGAN